MCMQEKKIRLTGLDRQQPHDQSIHLREGRLICVLFCLIFIAGSVLLLLAYKKENYWGKGFLWLHFRVIRCGFLCLQIQPQSLGCRGVFWCLQMQAGYLCAQEISFCVYQKKSRNKKKSTQQSHNIQSRFWKVREGG